MTEARDTQNGESPDVEVVQESPSSEKHVILARQVFPDQLPVVPLDERPLFPRMTVPMLIDRPPLKEMLLSLARSSSRTKLVGLVLKREADRESGDPAGRAGLHSVGVIAEILRLAQASEEGGVQVLLAALDRFRIRDVTRRQPTLLARVEYLYETEMTDNPELKAYSISVIQSIKELIQLNPLHKEELSLFMQHSSLNDPGRLADIAAALTTADGAELQEVLETLSIRARLKKVLYLLKKEIDISKLQVKISKQIEEKLSQQQRRFFLREQLKAIKKELGLEKEGKEAEIERFEKRVADLDMPEEAAARVNEELDKLRLIEPASPEFTVTRNYLDWLTSLPWGVMTTDNYDLRRATRILNSDHYGLDDIKDRILEFLSVGALKGSISGSILCFVGPPGVGKTSLGRSIARAIGRNFYRFSVGGIRDEAEIKGHRRTYIGALPGKFLQAVKTAGSANPVIMLDEIDKVGASYHGDPASALLEVLDPEQNRDFLDHYLDVRFDLSNVFFICTANQLDTIPWALLDRMEVIKLAGYIMQEKLQIARRHLVPRQLREHGVDRKRILLTSAALREIIEGYAREPGVRGLENHIKKVVRKTVKQLVEAGDPAPERVRIEPADIADLLGKRVFSDEPFLKKARPGVVMGLAWTRLGGDVMYVEAARVDTGKAGFKQTGQLGKVMVESSEIAYTYVRSFLDRDPAVRKFFLDNFIHLHVPAGATPKDGPSAGVTMACALYSLARGVPVRRRVAMTGELTLAGRIMPVGGIKEKTIAAKRAKVRELVFPAENRKDFEELPERVRKGLVPHYVDTFADVVAHCFRRRVRSETGSAG
ncbi:MAG: endopeptidase La [Lentisphaerae bacterium]|nr:endopeptidase La [Lentisphaerota bacterium]